jgi:hypothetical protein
MNKAQIERLQHKKQQLLSKLAVQEKLDNLQNAWEYHFHVLEQLPFSIIYAGAMNDQEWNILPQVLNDHSWANQKFTIHQFHNGEDYPVHAQIFRKLPSQLPLRYLPDLPIPESLFDMPHQNIKQAASELGIQTEKVYYLLARFPVVVMLEWETVILYADLLFNTPLGEDIILTTPTLDWLIFRSMEDEWRRGII